MKRKIAVVTTSRADFGIYRPLLRRLMDDDRAELHLIVGGMHLRPEFGMTVREIETEDFPIAARVDHLVDGSGPVAIAESMGRGTTGYAAAIAETGAELVVVLGDRFEMHAAAVAALPLKVGIAHLHGGELTLGALDDSFRHSITKLSHLHFVATDEFAKRVIQMGEEPWRVTVAGALGLDNLDNLEPIYRAELEARVGMPLHPAPLLVTYHPETRDPTPAAEQIAEVLGALADTALPLVITAPNADEGGDEIRRRILAFAESRANVRFVENLGTRAYFGLMASAAAMAGNTSSGIVEAASFKLPVVDIGKRQEGRPRAANVITIERKRENISGAIEKAVSAGFRAGLAELRNPYAGSRPAGEIIADTLISADIDERLIKKGFHDLKS
jgi:UDP-hydrolysing UDP-N-acetyl-D-glucosamine 2-epimerase